MKARRLFAGVAVEASQALRQVMAEWQEALREERIRWVRPEKLHLTVEFFGETADDRIPALDRALAQAARQTPPFAMKIGGLGVYGNLRHPRVLWAGIESAGLLTLHERVEASLREASFPLEPRAFTPHLTLGRMGGLKNPRRFGDAFQIHREWAGPETPIRELILFESRPGGRGTEYVPLGRHLLSGE